MSYEKIDKLIDITREKNKLLKDMLILTEKQKEQIDKDSYEGINRSLDEKDRIMKEIDKLDKSFLEIFTEIKREKAIKDISQLDPKLYPNLKELKKAVEEVTSTLSAISLIDKENTKAMREKLESTKKELTKIKAGKKAYKGYNYRFAESMLIDEKK
jgi:IMP dehydrogenase/GMP reductase